MGESVEISDAPVVSEGDQTRIFLPVEDDNLNWELHERNMEAFRRHQPGIAMDMEQIDTPHSRLISDGDGGFDIEFRGSRLYGMAGHEWAADRSDFSSRSSRVKRLILGAPDSHNLDDDANVTIHRIIKRSVESGMEFSRQPIDDQCFHLVIMGIALGDHLEHFIDLTNCQHALLVEPNHEFIYWSTFVFDWSALYKKFVNNGRKLSIIPYQTLEKVAECVRDRMRYINPSFIDSTYFIVSYPSSVMEGALAKLLAEKNLFITGLGFLEDEIDMVRNSYHNLKKFKGHYYKCFGEKGVQPLPAFVIGAGPSLDNDIDFIRENQDRAIIISCGTAVRVLLANDIKPDFQVEIENVPAVTELTELVSQKMDLSGITLIATSTVDPGVQTFYDRTVFYFRGSLASYPLFNQGPDSTIRNSTPNIANLGFSFAQEIGCRSIYLFGADLGARDPKKHHADDSAYNTGEVAFNTTIDQPTPANFGGEVFSEMLYLWTKSCLEEAVNRFPANRTYYNCSDGVRIAGTVPKLSSEIVLPATENKAADIEAIIENFPAYTKKHFKESWDDREPAKRMKRFRDLLLSRCDEPPVDPQLADEDLNDGYDIKPPVEPDSNVKSDESEDADNETEADGGNGAERPEFAFRYLCDITRDFIPDSGHATAEMHYYRGSTFMSMAAIYFYYQRALNAGENRSEFLKIVQEEFIDQTKRIADVVLKFYETLEPKKKTRKKAKSKTKKAAKPKKSGKTTKTATAKAKSAPKKTANRKKVSKKEKKKS